MDEKVLSNKFPKDTSFVLSIEIYVKMGSYIFNLYII